MTSKLTWHPTMTIYEKIEEYIKRYETTELMQDLKALMSIDPYEEYVRLKLESCPDSKKLRRFQRELQRLK